MNAVGFDVDDVMFDFPKGEVWYRYWDGYFWKEAEDWAGPHLEAYPVLSKTPCGVWLDIGEGRKKFVLNVYRDSKKRFAYPTIREAQVSYLARKRHAIKHAENAYEKQRYLLEKARAMVNSPAPTQRLEAAEESQPCLNND